MKFTSGWFVAVYRGSFTVPAWHHGHPGCTLSTTLWVPQAPYTRWTILHEWTSLLTECKRLFVWLSPSGVAHEQSKEAAPRMGREPKGWLTPDKRRRSATLQFVAHRSCTSVPRLALVPARFALSCLYHPSLLVLPGLCQTSPTGWLPVCPSTTLCGSSCSKSAAPSRDSAVSWTSWTG